MESGLVQTMPGIGGVLTGASIETSGVIFVIVTASFYAGLANRVPGLDVNSEEVRAQLPPLNAPDPSVPPETADAAREASTEAFHLAMLTTAILLALGAAVNAFGIDNRQALEPVESASAEDDPTDQLQRTTTEPGLSG